ncbi:xanthine dehydrogenase family protein molybdopterin-binding subunit [Nonomuraea sp. NPDC049714]|uniref:xanthine dehydrogenase family protein molybdopterin-binding subunit n=1 Tax=Nonomuraea sp. NPDC049714 TaxID=3364357 RepID=UPI0037903DD1
MTPESRVIGLGLDRVDGPAKVTGAATYTMDVTADGLLHAALVRSTFAVGTITSIETAQAEAAPGVVAVFTRHNVPRLKKPSWNLLTPPPPVPLQDGSVHHYGQYVAMVVAETHQQATAAAALIRVDHEAAGASLSLNAPALKSRTNPYFLDAKRGDAESALAAADVVIDATFTTQANAHNPLGLFSTVARWDGEHLIVHDSTQNPYLIRDSLAKVFSISKDKVQVLAPYVGGGFGAGLRLWQHVILTAMAARAVGRPVKTVLTRPQMFTGIGHRPATIQRMRVGARRDGTITAIDHEATSTAAKVANVLYPVTLTTPATYRCDNVRGRDRQVRLDIPSPAHMRGPGEAEGNFALETALDEVACAIGMDPVELRMRNYAKVHPQTGLAWSSKALDECYRQGAERFGWAGRTPQPRSMRDGQWLVGYGMAGVTYSHFQAKCQASLTVRDDGTVLVRSGATDIGQGTYTVITQVAADGLGLDPANIRCELGDTGLPRAPQAGGSGLATALSNAVHDATVNAIEALLASASADPASPLHGCSARDVAVAGGRIHREDDASRGETYVAILARSGRSELTVEGSSAPSRAEIGALLGSFAVSRMGRAGRRLVEATHAIAPAGAFAAHFVEVRVDPQLGRLRVQRMVSAVDAGQVLNEKLARSQIIGGVVGGIGQALFEGITTDVGSGRISNATLADYLVPVNADVPDLDVVFVGEPDSDNAVGVKGIGEIGLVGVAAAIGNAIHHATGKRLRSLPFTITELMD